jgi:outer membrane protein W
MAEDKLSESQIVRFKRMAQLWEWIKSNILPVALIAAISGTVGGLAGHFEAYIGIGYRLSALESAQTKTNITLDNTLGAGSELGKDVASLKEDVKILMAHDQRIFSNVDFDYAEKARAEKAARARRNVK